jgi:ketosteroid isomerase-like protein
MRLTPASLRAFSTVAAIALLGACSAKVAAPSEADNAKIADAVKADATQLVADFNARDAEKAVSHDAPDYVGMFHGMPNVVGPEADLALTKQQLADPAAKVAVSDEDVSVAAAGDRALWRATYAYTFTDPKTKEVTTENGNWLLGYRKQGDGSWKIAWGVVSDTGPAAAAPAAAPAPA